MEEEARRPHREEEVVAEAEEVEGEARRPHREEEVVEEAVEEAEGEARRPHREEVAVEEVSCNSLLTNVDSVVSCESLVVRLCC